METQVQRLEQLNQMLKEAGAALLKELFPDEKTAMIIHDDVLIGLTNAPLRTNDNTLLPQGHDDETITLKKLQKQHPEAASAKGILFSALLSPVDEAIRVETIETHPLRRRAGLTSRFLQILMQIGKENGARFLVGEHSNTGIAAFFIKRGAFLQIELKKDIRRNVRGSNWPSFERLPLTVDTVFFINEEDKALCVEPGRISQDLDARIEYAERYTALLRIFRSIEDLLGKDPSTFKPATLSTLIEVISDFQPLTSTGEGEDFDEDDELTMIKLKSTFARLKVELEEIAKHISKKDLRSSAQAIAELL